MKIKYQRIAVLVVALLFFGGMAMADEARQATIANLGGEVLVRQGQGNWQRAQAGMPLNTGDELKTEEGASVEVLLDKGQVGTVKIEQKSLFRINTLDADPRTGDKFTLLELAIGKVMVHAEKLQRDSKFEVKTPTSTTGVRGTLFEVKVE